MHLIQNIKAWAQGKNPWVRLPLLGWFAYLLFQYWHNPNFCNILDSVNFIIHEAGHPLFSYFGHDLQMWGGTILQLLAPFLLMWNFYRQAEYLGIALCFGWLSTSLFHVARYVADARAMELELLGWGETVEHDWNYILFKLHALQYDTLIAGWIRQAAFGSMVLCLVLGFWILLQMRRKPE
jgi:hypothetical protein